jgi:hypothetical protein
LSLVAQLGNKHHAKNCKKYFQIHNSSYTNFSEIIL